ncbi:PilN domain-containing protein [Fusobacterium nucleatum]|uniref:PilN domain-containing protein n=1 Tax=Fusobacterium nucleatum TaxID=851 RepID=UPI00235F3412|nr:PilN domain-containing protein [Fusobacterium nucleatum]WDD89102.1 PilN domain-containing protein [Fusobacterium nucleatum]
MFKKILPLSHIDDIEKRVKNTVLNLENKFFSIFKIQVENIINEEDRLEKLEDRLEVIFPRYNSDDFVLRYEIIKKDRKKENIVVYLLDLSLLNDYIIDDMKDYGFVSIIPSFFVCREKKILNHYFNFDISETMLVVTEYMNNNILDISTFKLSKSSFNEYEEEVDIEDKYSIANSYLVNIEDDIEIIFTGNKINFDELDLINKNYSYFDVENLDFTKYLNFLPDDIKNKYSLFYVNIKYLYTLLIISILTILSTIILYHNIHNSEEKLEQLEIESSSLEDKINEARNEMEEIEKQHKELLEFINKEKYKDFKISSLLEELSYLCPNGVKISSIEYDENKIFNIEGSTGKIDNVVKFLKNITNSKNFKLYNYDYILRKENEIEFKLEIKYF